MARRCGGTGAGTARRAAPARRPSTWRPARTVSRVLAWHHAGEHVPTAYHVEAWNGSAWVNVGRTSSRRTDLADYPPATGLGFGATEQPFPAITANKIRSVIGTELRIDHAGHALQASGVRVRAGGG